MSDQDEAERIVRRIVMGEFDGQFGNAAAADLIRTYGADQARAAAEKMREHFKHTIAEWVADADDRRRLYKATNAEVPAAPPQPEEETK